VALLEGLLNDRVKEISKAEILKAEEVITHLKSEVHLRDPSKTNRIALHLSNYVQAALGIWDIH